MKWVCSPWASQSSWGISLIKECTPLCKIWFIRNHNKRDCVCVVFYCAGFWWRQLELQNSPKLLILGSSVLKPLHDWVTDLSFSPYPPWCLCNSLFYTPFSDLCHLCSVSHSSVCVSCWGGISPCPGHWAPRQSSRHQLLQSSSPCVSSYLSLSQSHAWTAHDLCSDYPS